MSEHGVIPDATVGSGEPSTVEQAGPACGCKAYGYDCESPEDAVYDLPSQGKVVGHTTIHIRSRSKAVPSLDLPEYDAELARVAADKRVFAAAEKLVDRMKQAVGESDSAAQQWLDRYSYELFAAVDARRALDNGEGEVPQ